MLSVSCQKGEFAEHQGAEPLVQVPVESTVWGCGHQQALDSVDLSGESLETGHVPPPDHSITLSMLLSYHEESRSQPRPAKKYRFLKGGNWYNYVIRNRAGRERRGTPDCPRRNCPHKRMSQRAGEQRVAVRSACGPFELR